jgi:hypothetical protein
MVSNPFVDRMNANPKDVATRTLCALQWNAVPSRAMSQASSGTSSNTQRATSSSTATANWSSPDGGRPIDEFHLLLTPVALGAGQHLFELIEGAPQLNLIHVERFRSGVVMLICAP